MMMKRLLLAVSPLALPLASTACSAAEDNSRQATAAPAQSTFQIETIAQFQEPWAMAFDAGTQTLFVTERKGAIRFVTPDRKIGTVSGVPNVAYGGQGGLGDFKFAPHQHGTTLDKRVVYLTWAEAGESNGDKPTAGAVLGKADLVCPQSRKASPALSCRLDNLTVIWRQTPKVEGQGHYSHRIAFSPDGQYLFLSSGERQKMTPAQDLKTNLGKIVRLNLDGTPAAGNPFADKGSLADQIWSYGHRNVLGLAFDTQGRLWDLEHGPAGGDELNLVKPAANYGWPLVSDGNHYNGTPIPRNATRPDLAQPAITWSPVIAPGNFIFYTGDLFPAWKDKAIIAGMVYHGLVQVRFEGESAVEEARYPLTHRIRDLAQAADGSVWVLEDGKDADSGHLLRLFPSQSETRSAR